MLKEKLKSDLIEALKNKNTVKRDLIKLVQNRINNYEKVNGVEVTNGDIQALIKKELKETRDSYTAAVNAHREDLIALEEQKISYLTDYLPKQLNEKQILNYAKEIYADGMNRGEFMKLFLDKFRNVSDGQTVNKVINENKTFFKF